MLILKAVNIKIFYILVTKVYKFKLDFEYF